MELKFLLYFFNALFCYEKRVGGNQKTSKIQIHEIIQFLKDLDEVEPFITLIVYVSF